MQLGRFQFEQPLVLAPMAGVTDRPFRILCKRLGADLAVSEMVTSNSALFASPKTRTRMDHKGEVEPRIIQIAGGDVAMMVEAARLNESLGAHVIDINMGCPAKKVCNKLAGSALLSDEPLVYKILSAVVKSVDIPVTLKIRTGPDRDNRNGETIARIAQDCGIAMLSVHGRTRADKFLGEAEYETIARIVQTIDIPVLANGDVTTPEDAQRVFKMTGAAGVMIGRAAQGNPWIFREIKHYLTTGAKLPAPNSAEKASVLKWHLKNLYDLYGEYSGVRIARKHIAWYCKGKPHAAEFRQSVYRLETAEEQLEHIELFFGSRPMEKFSPSDEYGLMNEVACSPLQEQVEKELEQYFRILNGQAPNELHDLVISQVEEVLFRVVLKHCGGNQSRAAVCLGINRGTLRKKLLQYNLA